ncbi:MAG: RND transporter [Rhodothermia bacterium]|nr:RND transporter [Rhodothermia bacterium]
MNLLDRMPLTVLVIAALLLGIAPLFPQPHLWEKLVMLVNGELSRPADVFDLIVHGGPILLVIWKIKRDYTSRDTDLPPDSAQENLS